MRWPQITFKHRKAREEITAFAALVATPAAGTLTLPGRARLALRSVAGTAEDTEAATVVTSITRTLYVPELAAGSFSIVDGLERGAEVTINAGFELLLDTGLGKFVLIAEGA